VQLAVRATEFYRLTRSALGKPLEAAGFARIPKSRASWFQQQANGYNLLVSFEVDARGWDLFHGSSFVIDFEMTKGMLPGGMKNRGRFGQRLPEADLGAILEYQNEVIVRLRRPLANEVGFQDSDPAGEYYLKAFFDVEDEVNSNDLHFRYYESVDVEGWHDLLAPMLPLEVDRFRQALSHSVEPEAPR
jgi:hypothetical protein